MGDPVTFRPRSGPIFATITFISAAIYTYQSFAYFSITSGVTTLLWASLISSLAYSIFIRPKVIIFDEGVTIINPLYQVTIPWSEVITIDVRYTMSIRMRETLSLPWHREPTDTIYAFAAPAPGRYHSRSIHPTEIRGVGIDHGMALRPGDSPRSDSGQAAALARLRLARFERGEVSAAIDRDFTRNLSLESLLGVLLLLIALDVAL